MSPTRHEMHHSSRHFGVAGKGNAGLPLPPRGACFIYCTSTSAVGWHCNPLPIPRKTGGGAEGLEEGWYCGRASCVLFSEAQITSCQLLWLLLPCAKAEAAGIAMVTRQHQLPICPEFSITRQSHGKHVWEVRATNEKITPGNCWELEKEGQSRFLHFQ